jgi:dephospho-CoA kinase
MTKIIGLTGGIGSGNYDVVILIFGYSRLYSGRWSTKIMQMPEVIDAIKETFGTTLWRCCSKKKRLAEIVFSDLKTATTQCDCPPAVKRHFKQWLLGKKAFLL